MKLTRGIAKIKNIVLSMENKQKKIAIGAGIALLLVIIPCIIIQAKFMKKANAKSVSSASGFYFSSNKLSVLNNTNSEDENRAQYVIEGWDGKSEATFGFDIRDFENPLLYNNDKQKITYKITYEQDNYPTSLDAEVIVAGSDDIPSGGTDSIGGNDKDGTNDKYNSNNYVLSVKPRSNITQDFKVNITIETTDSPYPRTLGATIVWKYSEYASYLAEKGFKKVGDQYAGENITDEDYALVYGVGTAVANNSSINNASNAVTVLEYSWNNEKLGFERFNLLNKGTNQTDKSTRFKEAILNETSLTLTKEDGSTEEVIVTDENKSKFKNVLIMDKDKKKGYLYFETVAYSYYAILMYKKDSEITVQEAIDNDYADVKEIIKKKTTK